MNDGEIRTSIKHRVIKHDEMRTSVNHRVRRRDKDLYKPRSN